MSSPSQQLQQIFEWQNAHSLQNSLYSPPCSSKPPHQEQLIVFIFSIFRRITITLGRQTESKKFGEQIHSYHHFSVSFAKGSFICSIGRPIFQLVFYSLTKFTSWDEVFLVRFLHLDLFKITFHLQAPSD